MSDQDPPLPAPAPNGPCIGGQQHSFTTIYVTDPFTGETRSVTMCTGCGSGA